jgi:hypothetical protein
LKRVLLILALFSLGSSAYAIDPSEVILTLDGAFARPLGPQHFTDSYYGYGLLGMIEKTIGSKYSIGVAYSQYTILNNPGDRWGMSALDLVGRRWFHPWHAFNPYFLLGLGANIFKDSYKQPFGDVFHTQLALGSQYIFDSHWAMDYALNCHVLAPLSTPYYFVGAQLGLSYRYGTQPRRNRIAPPPVEANSVEELSTERVSRVVGSVNYHVKEGDSLYGIAGRPHLLGDPNLWPLVAENNAMTVEAAQLIIPGQVLKVRHNYSQAQRKAALAKASKIDYHRPILTAEK